MNNIQLSEAEPRIETSRWVIGRYRPTYGLTGNAAALHHGLQRQAACARVAKRRLHRQIDDLQAVAEICDRHDSHRPVRLCTIRARKGKMMRIGIGGVQPAQVAGILLHCQRVSDLVRQGGKLPFPGSQKQFEAKRLVAGAEAAEQQAGRGCQHNNL
ncbi:hypothetical protein J2T09_000011 [Neorhizobium huautlense]|uniref:Uncharacterized protein n=1 Tax=Neorhizobium huautlense TaxID=67774 RepID=A0ABT9PLB9_9HYPH|nr:hypothetical protein [Neorhizobium huautlense]MDP9835270.1 hypothetical protein [Neorhizobium huautlense]